MLDAQSLGIEGRDIGGLLAQDIVQPQAAAGLGAAVVLIEPAAGAEHQGIFLIRHFRRRGPIHRGEAALAAGETAILVQGAGARMLAIGHRPLQAVALDAVVLDAHQ